MRFSLLISNYIQLAVAILKLEYSRCLWKVLSLDYDEKRMDSTMNRVKQLEEYLSYILGSSETDKNLKTKVC